MKLRKMSNARRHNYPVVFMGLAPTIVLTNLHKKERNLFDGAIIVLMGGCKLDTSEELREQKFKGSFGDFGEVNRLNYNFAVDPASTYYLLNQMPNVPILCIPSQLAEMFTLSTEQIIIYGRGPYRGYLNLSKISNI